MPARIFDEWAAYDQIEPIGPARGDIQAAIIAATVDNGIKNIIYILTGERLAGTSISDFMIDFGATEPEKEEASPENLYDMMKSALILGLQGEEI